MRAAADLTLGKNDPVRRADRWWLGGRVCQLPFSWLWQIPRETTEERKGSSLWCWCHPPRQGDMTAQTPSTGVGPRSMTCSISIDQEERQSVSNSQYILSSDPLPLPRLHLFQDLQHSNTLPPARAQVFRLCVYGGEFMFCA